MFQLSKVLISRDEWKNKAAIRGEQNREDRKRIKSYRNQIIELKKTINELKDGSTEEPLKKKC